MKNLYLDIDGVLIDKQGSPAKHLVEFLEYVTRNFNCYWLTTHCSGDATTPFLYLVGKLPKKAIPFIETVKPTKWNLWKTEGIDYSKDFFWLDDYIFEGEKKILEKHGVFDKLIIIDLQSNPNQLAEVLSNQLKVFL